MLLAAGFLAGCSGGAEEVAGPRNLVLISIDTCRADRVGPYRADSRDDVTPHIDALAAEGVLFERALSPAPTTLPAHASMLTGTIPPYHGVHDNGEILAGDNRTLAEILGEAGWDTAAFVGALVLDEAFGIAQGFDTFDPRFDTPRRSDRILERRAEHVSDAAIEWLDQREAATPFFLFLHYYDPHQLFDPPEPYASRFADDLYDGEIAYTDAHIGRVLERLEALGVSESTLLVVTSDHGEMLGEHGELSHSYYVYEGAIRVPMVFHGPGVPRGRRVDGAPVGLVDLVPTVCSMLDVQLPEAADLDGIDLTPRMQAEAEAATVERAYYAEAVEATKYGSNPHLAWSGPRLKYIESRPPELFDPLADPGEEHNLAPDDAVRTFEMRDALFETIESRQREFEDTGVSDAAAAERLRGLGYVGAGSAGSDRLAVDSERPTPRETLEFHVLNHQVPHLIFDGKLDQARARAERMLSDRDDYYGGHRYMGEIALAEKRPAAAAEHFAAALERKPGDAVLRRLRADSLHRLGVRMQTQGHRGEAMARYREAIEAEPGHVDALTNLADLSAAGGDLDGAIELYGAALEHAPDHAEIHRRLGVALAYSGRPEQAVASYRRAVELNPESFELHAELGRLLIDSGRREDGVAMLQRAVQLAPSGSAARGDLEALLNQ
ncbi:hypothetical protein ABI59_11410 [Acidobacteria bacterium Mor1]|nr:hypothetical protein ABI59_11410 [Acidobacteria bacterium Mor1]